MPWVGIGELARVFKVDAKAIRVAVEKGLLSRREDGAFDLATATQEWEGSVNHERGHNNRTPHLVQARQEGTDEAKTEEGRTTKGSDFAKARAMVHVYEARLKKLRYEERAGTLALVRDIEHARFQEMRIVRDACLNLPARVSAQIAAESNEHKVYQILENEILAIFSDYAEGKIA